jgi:hypothetical protein
MLASVFPAGKVAALAGKLAKAASKAAAKALLKQFAKSIAKQLMKKTKRKVKKFMKSEVKGAVRALKDEAVDAILEEAAEAFAIERTKKDMKGYSVPDFEEVARACDPIGVMDVIDAFDLNSCDDTEIEPFPACSSNTFYDKYSLASAMMRAEAECCFGYTTGRKELHFMWWSLGWYNYATCNQEGSHIFLHSTNSTEDDDGLNWLDDNVDPEGAVDVIWDESPVSSENFQFCMFCSEHSSCLDNEIPGANLTLYNACVEATCCSESPTGLEDTALIQEAEEPDCSFCDNFSMCTAIGSSAYDTCNDMGCCEGMDDPNAVDYVPPPIDESASAYHGGEITDHPENVTSTGSTTSASPTELAV